MARPQILIVEDDHDLREALVTTLELARFRVREARREGTGRTGKGAGGYGGQRR